MEGDEKEVEGGGGGHEDVVEDDAARVGGALAHVDLLATDLHALPVRLTHI